jgi:hypothetical protein
MALHSKKTKNKLLITLFSISGFLLLLSWSWLLLYIPSVSNNAGIFLNRYLKQSQSQKESQNSNESTDLETTSSEVNETQSNETKESNSTASNSGSTAAEKLTIDLQVNEGPIYSASDDVCYYIVKAIVTGKPTIVIKFSKDDSSGSLGFNKARINLKRNLKTYTLTATASNSQGTAMDSITLNWGCNSNPVISEAKLSSDTVYINKQYELTVKANDPDGDKLSYKWTVSGGSLVADNLATVKWNTPSKADNYDVKVVVQDNKGGSTSKSISVYVGEVEVTETTEPPSTTPPTTAPPSTAPPTTAPAQTSLDLPKKTNEGGYLEHGGGTYPGGNVYAGDSANNKPCVGFISFDITGLAGKTIDAVALTLSSAAIQGNPLEYLDYFWINVANWGAGPITQNDFNLTGIAIQNFNSPGITCTADKLKSELQKAINSSKSRFQIRVHFAGPYTDNDSSRDGWEYTQSNINLNVKFN